MIVKATITIGKFEFATKEVKSRLQYLNENPLIFLKSLKNILGLNHAKKSCFVSYFQIFSSMNIGKRCYNFFLNNNF